MSDPFIPSSLIAPGINDARSRALIAAFSDELEAIDNHALLIQDALTIDKRLLPEMAVARAMTDFILPGMREELVRNLLHNAHEIHAKSGYISGTRLALELIGVRVDWTQWFNQNPIQHHDTHKVRVFFTDSLIEGADPLDVANQQVVFALFEATKRFTQDIAFETGVDITTPVYTGVFPQSNLVITAYPFTFDPPVVTGQLRSAVVPVTQLTIVV